MSADNVLDFDLLNGYLDNLGKAMLEKMFALYSQQAPKYMQAIAQSVIDESSEDWQESCHKMKGAASSAGFVKVQQALLVMEKSNGNSTAKQALLSQLKQLNKDCEQKFERWLTSI